MNEINVNFNERASVSKSSDGRAETTISKNISAGGNTINTKDKDNNMPSETPKRVMRKIVIDPEKLKTLGLNRKIAKALGDGINTPKQTTTTKPTSLDTVSIESNLIKRNKATSNVNAKKLSINKKLTLTNEATTSTKTINPKSTTTITTTTAAATTSNSPLTGVQGLFAKYRPQLDYNLMTPNLRILHAKNILQGFLLKRETNNKNNNYNNNSNNNNNNNNKKANQCITNNNKNKKNKYNIDDKNDSRSLKTAQVTHAKDQQSSNQTTTAIDIKFNKKPTTTTKTHNIDDNYYSHSNSSSSSATTTTASTFDKNDSFCANYTSDNNNPVTSNERDNINESIKISNCEIIVPITTTTTTTITATTSTSSPPPPLSTLEIENVNLMKNLEVWHSEPQLLRISIPQEQNHQQLQQQQQQAEEHRQKFKNSEKCYKVAPQISPLKLTFHKAHVLPNTKLPTISTFNNLSQNNDYNYNNNNNDYNNLGSSIKKSKRQLKESKPIVLEHKILSPTEKFEISALNSTATTTTTSSPINVVFNNDIIIMKNSNNLKFDTNFDNHPMSIEDMPFDIITDNTQLVEQQPIEIVEQNSHDNILIADNSTSTLIKEENLLEDNETMNAVDFLISLSQTSDIQGYELTEREKRRKARRSKKVVPAGEVINSTVYISDDMPEVKMEHTQQAEYDNAIEIDNIPIVLEGHHSEESLKQVKEYIFENAQFMPETWHSSVQKSSENQRDDSDMEAFEGFEGFEDEYDKNSISPKVVEHEDKILREKCSFSKDLEDYADKLINLVNIETTFGVLKPKCLEQHDEQEEHISAEVMHLEAQAEENQIESYNKIETTFNDDGLEHDDNKAKIIEVKTNMEIKYDEHFSQDAEQVTRDDVVKDAEKVENPIDPQELHVRENMERELDRKNENREKCQNNVEIIENSNIIVSAMDSQEMQQQQQQQEQEDISNSNKIPLKKRWELSAQKSNIDDDDHDTDYFHITDDGSPIEDDADDDHVEKSSLEIKYDKNDNDLDKNEEEEVAKIKQEKSEEVEEEKDKGGVGAEEKVEQPKIIINNNNSNKDKKKEHKNNVNKEKLQSDKKSVETIVKTPRKKRRASEVFLANLKSAKQSKQNRLNFMKERKEKREMEIKAAQHYNDKDILKVSEKKKIQNKKVKLEVEPDVEMEVEPKPELVIMTTIVKISERLRSKTQSTYNNNNNNYNNKKNDDMNKNKKSLIAKKDAQKDIKKKLLDIEKAASLVDVVDEGENKKLNKNKSISKEILVEDKDKDKDKDKGKKVPVKIVQEKKIITRRTTINNKNNNIINDNDNINENLNEHINIENVKNNEMKATDDNNILSRPMNKKLRLENSKANEFEIENKNLTAQTTNNKKNRKSQNKTIADYFIKTLSPDSSTIATPTTTSTPITPTIITNATMDKRKRTRRSHELESTPTIFTTDVITMSNYETPTNVPPKKRPRKSKTPTATSDKLAPSLSPGREITPTPCWTSPPPPTTPSPLSTAADQSTGPKKRGRKPKSFTACMLASKNTGQDMVSPNAVSNFNSRLLLVRTRAQLDTDEILTITTNNNNDNINNDMANDNNIDIKPNLIQCGLCLAFTNYNNWNQHKAEHYGIGWIVGAQQPLDTTKRSRVLSSIIQYFKETKAAELKCRMCERSYRSGLGLLVHIENCGVEVERVACPHCEKLLSKLSINVHIRGCAKSRSTMEEDDDNDNASDTSKTYKQLSITGRSKRESTIKAEKKLKLKTDGSDDRLVQHVPAMVEADMLEEWRQKITAFGKLYCVHNKNCTFMAENCDSMLEHYNSCPYARPPGYYCKLCTNNENDYVDIKPFASESETMLHVKSMHPQSEHGDSGSEFENKSDVESSSSDDEDIDDEDTICSEVNELEEEEEDKESTSRSIKSNKKRPSHLKKFNEVWYAKPRMFPMRQPNPTSLAQKRWQQFLKSNYSTSPLFNFAQATYKFTRKLTLEQLLPDHMTSMKFAFSKDSEPVSKLGVQPVPETCQQLKRFESTTHGCEFLMYLGASVKHMEWVPMPLSTSEQYLCISYRMHSQFTKLQSPEVRSDCIIIYKVNLTADNEAPMLEQQYALHIDNGPVHCFSFLPSGGYDEENNRLGLIAVGTVEQSIRIYALPLKIKVEEVASDKPISLIDVPIVMVLTSLESSLGSKKKHLVTKRAQCLNICWSESKGHYIIAAGFTNGYIGIWDIEEFKQTADTGHTSQLFNENNSHSGEREKNKDNNFDVDDDDDDFDKININIYYKNGIRHVKPINYFYNGEKMIRSLAMHYDNSHGVRWLAAATWSRKFLVYDLINLQRPLLIKHVATSNLITDINWSPIWESLMLAYFDPVPHQKNGDVAAAFNPTSLSFTRSKVDGMNCSLTQVQYNPNYNLHACSCDNGDIVLLDTREMYLEEILHRKTFRDARAISTMDLIPLNGKPLAYPTVDNTTKDSPMLHTLIDEENYMDKYALIFMPMSRFQMKFQKNYMNAHRRPHFFAERIMRINVMRFNRNPSDTDHNLLAVGHENGFLRVLRFKKSKYFN